MEDIKFTSRFFELMLEDVDSVKQAIEPETLELVQQKLRDLQDTDDEDEINAIGHAIIDLGMNSSAGDVFVSLNERALQYQGKGYEPQEFKPTRMGKVSTTVRGGDQVSVPSDKVKVKTLADLLSQRVGPIVLEPQIRTYRDSGEDGSGLAKEELRYANIGLFENDDPNNQSPCDRSEPLQNEKEYFLRVNIGQPMVWDCSDEKDRPEFVPGDILPQTDINGHWLDVIASASKGDFVIANGHQSLFLPLSGESWTCTCARAQKHTCTEQERQRFMYITVRTSKNIGDLPLDIAFYYKNNLLQNRVFTAHVGSPLTKTEPAYRSHTGYTLTPNFAEDVRVDKFPPNDLCIHLRKKEDGSNQIKMKGGASKTDTDIYIYFSDIGENELARTMTDVCNVLDSLDKKPASFRGIDLDEKRNKVNFVEDLQKLAETGRNLFYQIFKSEPSSRDELKKVFDKKDSMHRIQICVENENDSTSPFPWSFVYDIPLDSGGEYKHCKLLEKKNWESFQKQENRYVSQCPYCGEEDHKKNIICPFGFWGFRYVLTQPISTSRPSEQNNLHNKSVDVINISNKPLRMLASFYNGTTKYIETLRELLEEQAHVTLDLAGDTRKLLLEELKSDSELVYLMCHGDYLSNGEMNDPYLLIGKGEKLTVTDLFEWRNEISQPELHHWQNTSPLVFINGCHTTALTPNERFNFVDPFVQANASGVIGTEMSVNIIIAKEAAELFFRHLILEKHTVGSALREMRMDLLAEGNLFGLGYTAYCLSSLHLQEQLMF